MKVFNINWNKLIDMQLIISIRRPAVKAWIESFVNPIVILYYDFLSFRDKCLYKINHNSQIVFMEGALNDMFDNNLRRIRILNVAFKEPVYFYEPEERKEVFFYEPEDNKPVYFREQDEFIGDGVDFVVMVPPDLKPNTPVAELAIKTKMQGQIDYYKLYSKNNIILWELANV